MFGMGTPPPAALFGYSPSSGAAGAAGAFSTSIFNGSSGTTGLFASTSAAAPPPPPMMFGFGQQSPAAPSGFPSSFGTTTAAAGGGLGFGASSFKASFHTPGSSTSTSAAPPPIMFGMGQQPPVAPFGSSIPPAQMGFGIRPPVAAPSFSFGTVPSATVSLFGSRSDDFMNMPSASATTPSLPMPAQTLTSSSFKYAFGGFQAPPPISLQQQQQQRQSSCGSSPMSAAPMPYYMPCSPTANISAPASSAPAAPPPPPRCLQHLEKIFPLTGCPYSGRKNVLREEHLLHEKKKRTAIIH